MSVNNVHPDDPKVGITPPFANQETRSEKLFFA